MIIIRDLKLNRNQKPKKKQKKFTKEINIINYSFGFLFMALFIHIVHFMVVDSDEAINNAFNPRQEILASRTYRGNIYASGGEVLATTEMDSEDKETRIYPYDNLFSHTVGYDTNGKLGIEELANAQLLSSDIFVGDKVQNDLKNIKNPGNSVETTLDVELQKVALKSLGIYKGAIVVIEPKTGKIRAMVSTPDFDPNQIAEMWDELIVDDDNSSLLNRATQGLYPPGSVFKVVPTLQYMRENPENYQDYSYLCNGQHSVGVDKVKCYGGANHGNVDLEKSLAKSCNASFSNIGLELEYTEYRETLDQLLFDQELPLAMPYKQSSFVLEEMSPTIDTMQTAIGQGKTQVTPIHMAMITAAIANDGVLMKPYMIENIVNDTGNVIEKYNPKKYDEIMTEEEANVLKDMMANVVENGTGGKLSGLSYTAGCKTGSAEYNLNEDDSHAWTIAFAPVEEPELAVAIIVEEAGMGTSYAVPIVKRIFDAYFEK